MPTPTIAVMTRLKHSLQALAARAEIQRSLFPDWVVKTDELLLEFDNWRLTALGNYKTEMTAEQISALERLDAHISKGNLGNRVLGAESALESHPFWAETRTLAQQVLAAFGWPVAEPPSYAHEFVQERQTEE